MGALGEAALLEVDVDGSDPSWACHWLPSCIHTTYMVNTGRVGV